MAKVKFETKQDYIDYCKVSEVGTYSRQYGSSYMSIEDGKSCAHILLGNNGYLDKWAKQGVLLLNAVLTVQKDTPASHKGKGWEIFTDKIIEEINKKDEPVVFMLWGNFAKTKESLLTNPKHLVLTSAHPSPFSARHGFFGNNHFKTANEFLEKNGQKPIDWQIENI